VEKWHAYSFETLATVSLTDLLDRVAGEAEAQAEKTCTARVLRAEARVEAQRHERTRREVDEAKREAAREALEQAAEYFNAWRGVSLNSNDVAGWLRRHALIAPEPLQKPDK